MVLQEPDIELIVSDFASGEDAAKKHHKHRHLKPIAKKTGEDANKVQIKEVAQPAAIAPVKPVVEKVQQTPSVNATQPAAALAQSQTSAAADVDIDDEDLHNEFDLNDLNAYTDRVLESRPISSENVALWVLDPHHVSTMDMLDDVEIDDSLFEKKKA